MRILLLANNWVGWQVARWLTEQGEDIVGLVIHPPQNRKYGPEIVESAKVNPEHIFDGSRLREVGVLDAVRKLQADIALSAFFGYILEPVFLNMFPAGVINLHPSYLPYNRGAHPNIWSIIEETPAGATLHYVDSGVDTGEIITRVSVPVELTDTGKSLYGKLEQACVELFRSSWPLVKTGQAPRLAHDKQEGSYHRSSEVDKVDLIDLEAKYTARDLINIIRARTFSPYPGAYFIHEGRKIYLRLQLLSEQQLNEVGDECTFRD